MDKVDQAYLDEILASGSSVIIQNVQITIQLLRYLFYTFFGFSE